MTRGLSFVSVVVLLTGAALAQPPTRDRGVTTPRPTTPNTLRLLNQRIPEVSFDGEAFEDVMEWLKEFTGMSVIVRWETLKEAGVGRDKPVTLKVKNLRLSQVLWMIMTEAAGTETKLAYRASGSVLILSTADDLNREIIVRVYDVSDLLLNVPDFANAPRMDPAQAMSQMGQGGQGGGGGGAQIWQTGQQGQNEQMGQVMMGAGMQELITLIKTTIEPDSWADTGAGPGQIQAFGRMLVVSNTLLVHQQINGYIREEAAGP